MFITTVETLTSVTFKCGHTDVVLGYGESHDVNIAIALEVAEDEVCCTCQESLDASASSVADVPFWMSIPGAVPAMLKNSSAKTNIPSFSNGIENRQTSHYRRTRKP